MGYCISLYDQKFYIAAADKQQALKAAKPIYGHWVHEGGTQGCDTLEEVFDTWGYEADVDESGNITGLSLTNEKLGDELKLFQAIAPWVKAGSYLEISGEEGALWRWVFDGSACSEKTPKIEW
jgi:hypothetical protein